MSTFQEIRDLTKECAQTHSFTQQEIEAILFPSTTQLTPPPESTDDLMKQLNTLLQKRTRHQLHGSTLSEYVRAKRIPRGLRIQKIPTIGRNNEVFCTKWCEILNKASLDLTVLVIDFTQKELIRVEQELAVVKETLKTKSTETELKKIQDELDATTEKYQHELLKTKISKFKRDTNDYKEGRVYPWLLNKERPKPRRAINSDSCTSISSASLPSESEGDFLGAPADRGLPSKRRGSKRRPDGAGEGRRFQLRSQTRAGNHQWT